MAKLFSHELTTVMNYGSKSPKIREYSTSTSSSLRSRYFLPCSFGQMGPCFHTTCYQGFLCIIPTWALGLSSITADPELLPWVSQFGDRQTLLQTSIILPWQLIYHERTWVSTEAVSSDGSCYQYPFPHQQEPLGWSVTTALYLFLGRWFLSPKLPGCLLTTSFVPLVHWPLQAG